MSRTDHRAVATEADSRTAVAPDTRVVLLGMMGAG